MKIVCATIVTKCSYQNKGKVVETNKTSQPPLCSFEHLELQHKKISPCPSDIWVPSLPIEENRSTKIFIPGMEWWFRLGDRLTRVEHAGVTSRMLSWILEADQARNK
jgi:hypothetical protein